MIVTLTCTNCGSAINITPSVSANSAKCPICEHEHEVHFHAEHEQGELKECPSCSRHDFYSQADFNRAIGIAIFVVAAILSIWTYGISFIVAYLIDLFLFRKLSKIAICYKCQTIFRDVKNIKNFHAFDHYMNDQIQYNNKDFHGKQAEH